MESERQFQRYWEEVQCRMTPAQMGLILEHLGTPAEMIARIRRAAETEARLAAAEKRLAEMEPLLELLDGLHSVAKATRAAAVWMTAVAAGVLLAREGWSAFAAWMTLP